MALETSVPSAFSSASIPQIAEVLTGIPGRTEAMFMLDQTIGFISDESMLFMSFAWFFMSFPWLFMNFRLSIVRRR